MRGMRCPLWSVYLPKWDARPCPRCTAHQCDDRTRRRMGAYTITGPCIRTLSALIQVPNRDLPQESPAPCLQSTQPAFRPNLKGNRSRQCQLEGWPRPGLSVCRAFHLSRHHADCILGVMCNEVGQDCRQREGQQI